ncbi:YidB family protein [Ramlibacter albus]|uniref:DUF937 domain-containing protein n=1 Tax=Ramlibacter albus TaxID=2079448 RepID=A0A923M8T0_9BURK|nr:YidB family protein [Ramlibacter albus]MBC5764612.1 DUF937 domain-containing protein [Ramlibacter albus]
MNKLILGPLLGAILGRRMGGGALGRAGLGGRGAIVAMLLPYAMQWIQRNGGVGAVLKRFQEKGYSRQTASWVATGDNEVIDERAVEEVIGQNELTRLSQQLGVPEQEVKQDLAAALPEIVNQLTPQGLLGDDADRMLGDSLPAIEQEVQQARLEQQQH